MYVVILVASVASIYLTAWLAGRRGRSIRAWAWAAALIGPLAVPPLLMLPNKQREL